MLLYHFGTKERLITELLSYVAGLYAAGLDAVLAQGERPASRAALMARILEQNADPAFQPFMQLWWEIVGGAARGLPGFPQAAEAMVGELLVWLEGHMPAGDPDPAGGARFILTVIEGAMMLGAVGHRETARQGLLAGGLLQA